MGVDDDLGQGTETGDCEFGNTEVLAPADPNDLTHREHCWISESLSDQMDILAGEQIRVYRSPDEYALYTVMAVTDESGTCTIRMGFDGRQRLGTGSEQFAVEVSSSITADELNAAQAEAQGEFIELLTDAPSNDWLLIAAPHGGLIERHTAEQAEQVWAALAHLQPSSWICKGWRAGGGAFERWHISSEALSTRSFAGLHTIADREFCYAVAFHGVKDGRLDLERDNQDPLVRHILLGGLGPVCVKEAIRAEILARVGAGLSEDEIGIIDADGPIPGPYTGTSESNFVNWITAEGRGGIQIEQTVWVRNKFGDEIAAAVAAVFEVLSGSGCDRDCEG